MVQVGFFHSYFINSQNWLYQFMNNMPHWINHKILNREKGTTGCNGCEIFLHLKNWIQALSYRANFKPAQDVWNNYSN
jgi:hypothetical protein